jgi:hypothetical protein
MATAVASATNGAAGGPLAQPQEQVDPQEEKRRRDEAVRATIMQKVGGRKRTLVGSLLQTFFAHAASSPLMENLASGDWRKGEIERPVEGAPCELWVAG